MAGPGLDRAGRGARIPTARVAYPVRTKAASQLPTGAFALASLRTRRTAVIVKRRSPFLFRFLSLGLLLATAGCVSFPTYFLVGVDAITARSEVTGLSYRLVSKDATTYQDPEIHKLAQACVLAALETRGMFQAPLNTRPDLFVELDYGRGNSIRISARGSTQETYLSLSARMNIDDPATRGPEVWNVRATMADESGRLAVILPVLASVAADHAGLETVSKKELKVSDQAPGVVMIRKTIGIRER